MVGDSELGWKVRMGDIRKGLRMVVFIAVLVASATELGAPLTPAQATARFVYITNTSRHLS